MSPNVTTARETAASAQPIEGLLRLLTSTAEVANQMLGHNNKSVQKSASSPASPVLPATGLTTPALAIEGRLRLALSTDEVASLLLGRDDKAARSIVLRLIADGRLTAQCTGRSYLISTASLLAYLAISPTSTN
jgi:excisionase family DNA binding protein